jgi:hypothetical protein
MKKLTLAQIIDELGALEAEVAPLNPKLTRIKVLRDSIRERYAKQAADKDFVAEGTRYAVAIGACAWETEIDRNKLFKRIGKLAFLKWCGFTVKALKNFDPEVAELVITKAQTGTRSLDVMAKGTA